VPDIISAGNFRRKKLAIRTKAMMTAVEGEISTVNAGWF
jgi:uncharacterized protein YqgV (UPF0045/DUF77 family)